MLLGLKFFFPTTSPHHPHFLAIDRLVRRVRSSWESFCFRGVSEPSEQTLLVIEHHRPDLNTPPPSLVDVSRVLEGRVRCSSRYVSTRVAAFDEEDLVRPLLVLEVPLMSWRRFHGPRLALMVVVDDACRNEVFLGDRSGICNGQRVFEDCFYGTPGLQVWPNRSGI